MNARVRNCRPRDAAPGRGLPADGRRHARRPRPAAKQPDDWLEARDPDYIERTLPALRACERPLLPRRGRRPGQHPRRRARAARRQPLGRHADRRHVRLRAGLLRPLRRRPRASTSSRTTSCSRSPALARAASRYGTVPASPENMRRALDRDAALLVYPGGDHETYRPSWESDRDRLRRAHRLRPARDGAGRADRPGRGDRRAGDGAVPRPGQAGRPRCSGSTGAAAEGVPGADRAARRRHAARPAAAHPAARQDHASACSRRIDLRPSGREGRRRGLRHRHRPMQETLHELADERTLPVIG